jgi:hypothetical protein
MTESVWQEQLVRLRARPQRLGREEGCLHGFGQRTSNLAARISSLLAPLHPAGIKLFSFAHCSGKLASNELAAPPILVSLAWVFGRGQRNPKNSAA